MTPTTTITVRSETVFNGTGTLHPFSIKFWIANPAFDAEAPRLIGQAINPAAVAELGGTNRDGILVIIRKHYAGQGIVTVVWPDGREQRVRPFTVAS